MNNNNFDSSSNSNPNHATPELNPEPAESAEIVAIASFDDMELHDDLLHGIFSKGFERPSPIQAKAIKPLKDGFDLIAQAQSGTGKTGAFVIGALSRFEKAHGGPTILALEPVRELARQTAECFETIGTYSDLRVCLCIGGTAMQRADVKRADVIVGTPGRILDLVRRGWLSLAHVRTLIMDEADEMLSHGFVDDMREIVNAVPVEAQVAVFSATFSAEDLAITRKFAPKALHVLAKSETLTLEGIDQYFVAVEREGDKLDVLLDLFADLSVGMSIVFCNTRARVEQICRELERHDFTPVPMHADMSQAERTDALDKLRSGRGRVLVSSNVMARGIDVTGISCVFNFELPRDTATYLHRIGRAGRFGKKGVAISLVDARDVRQLRAIESHYHTVVRELPSDIAQALRGM